jgi:hypothetical protein
LELLKIAFYPVGITTLAPQVSKDLSFSVKATQQQVFVAQDQAFGCLQLIFIFQLAC